MTTFMPISDYDFFLPKELIAQKPLADRSSSKMLVINSKTGEIQLKLFRDIVEYINPNDALIFNNTKVIPARIFGHKTLEDGSLGAYIEALLIDEQSLNHWVAMLKPGKRVKEGTKIQLSENPNDYYIVEKKFDDGKYLIHFPSGNLFELLDRVGHIPLPPYIQREDNEDDRQQYQTVFAQNPGAVAAPTAGLHFTNEILNSLKDQGTKLADVTLHVGAGTFLPVKVDNILEHKMHSERYSLPNATAEIINSTKKSGGRIFAVGTTSVRVLESCAKDCQAVPGDGKTDIFIYPPYKPQIVNCLLTNFHLPKSTLLMLVSAFAGRDNIMKAYELAVKEQFRFFSYGDCMLII